LTIESLNNLMPFDLQVVGHLLHVDAGRGEIAQHLLGARHVLHQARARFAVLLKGHHGLLRHGIDGVGTDQFFDVKDIAVARVFGTGARPEAALHGGTPGTQLGELGFVEDPIEGPVGHLGVGHCRLA